MYDVLIKGGQVVDGTGIAARTADVAIKDGRIAEIGALSGKAKQTVDADGALVTPGWVDVHTHYDGQVSWDTAMDPSFSNGVGTVVMGNCGVGFAPVRPGTEKDLIELMEGVEDIPGAALTDGIEWGRWESFTEYMDYLSTREYALDVGAQVAHGSVRFYVMGERGKTDEDATADELTRMADLVAEAVQAGALGFSTSRTIGHRSLWGTPVPGTFAAQDEELVAIAKAMGRVGKGVVEAIPAGTVGEMRALGGERFTQVRGARSAARDLSRIRPSGHLHARAVAGLRPGHLARDSRSRRRSERHGRAPVSAGVLAAHRFPVGSLRLSRLHAAADLHREARATAACGARGRDGEAGDPRGAHARGERASGSAWIHGERVRALRPCGAALLSDGRSGRARARPRAEPRAQRPRASARIRSTTSTIS